MIKNKIKVLIIDDSKAIRTLIKRGIENDDDIIIVGEADNVVSGRDEIIYKRPDVVVLDIEMPDINGLEFLKILMKRYPLPVIIYSSLTSESNRCAIEAFELGAYDVILKPGLENISESIEKLKKSIKSAFVNKKKFLTYLKTRNNLVRQNKLRIDKNLVLNKVILMGASTGGTETLKSILMKLPEVFPPILIVQHMPAKFTYHFSKRLNKLCALTVKEAEDGDLIENGKVFIAPGDFHLMLEKRFGNKITAKLTKGPKVHYQRPAVDILFKSGAKVYGDKVIGVLLTGMGNDGAEGMKAIKEANGITIAQNEASSVVWGMPRSAIELGVVDYVLALNEIPKKLISLIS